MRPDDQRIREIFEQSFPVPSEDQTDLACERVLSRLNSTAPDSSAHMTVQLDPPNPLWRWWPTVALASAAAFVVFLLIVFPYVRPQVSPGRLEAMVENQDGSQFRLFSGKSLRTDSEGAVLTLADGSRIEVRSQSELALERAGDGVRIRMSQGGIIVSAAKQRAGHLYVQTKDVTVSVVGTVFSVNAEEAGSRVAVIQGEVHVTLGATSKRLLPGEQVATNPLMNAHPVLEEFSWSRNAEEHVALLEQSAGPGRTTAGGSAVVPVPEFEAASVKPATGSRPTRIRCRGIDGELDVVPAGSAVPAVPLGRCVAAAVPLLTLVATAYDMPRDRISGLPGSAETEMYQIEAKAEDPTTATRDQLRQMLQMMLIEQFKLKVHHENKEADGYVLSVGKSGIRFKETSGDEENYPAAPLTAGPRAISMKGKYRMKRFAGALSIFVGFQPVVDKTDLSGVYDMDFSLNPVPGPGLAAGGRGGGARMEFDPPLAKSLEEQLGLRLESRKVPVDYLVVEHVQKPADPAPAAAPTASTAPAAPASSQFEVSSVKRNNSNSQAITLAPTPSMYRATNVLVRMLITIAYHVEDFQISGEPGWVNSEHYDIEAKVDGTRTMQEINGPMLQALLADRFKLKIHGESKESPVYFLTVPRSGPKLKSGACLTRDPGTAVPAGQRQSAYCGYMGIGDNTMRATGISMEGLTGALSHILKRKVLDKTGFGGNFDVALRWSEDSSNGLPSIFTSLEEQLGLKLESGKAPLDVLVIDRIERPLEN